MLDLKSFPVVDHHCHPYDPAKAVLEPEALAREFFHGRGDIPKVKRQYGASKIFSESPTGVVRTVWVAGEARLRLGFYRDAVQLLDDLNQPAVIVIALVHSHQSRDVLLNGPGQGEAQAEFLCRDEGVLEILLVQPDLESGFEVALQHKRYLGVEHV